MSKKRILTTSQILTLGFLIIIFVGALLLWLPISSETGEFTPFVDCLFTATSATCVTGLVTVNTAAHWNYFGEIVIILLIQIGGLGFMTFVTLISFFVRKQVGLFDRKLFMQSAGISDQGSVKTVFKQILLGTLTIEGCGALLLSIVFVPDYGAIGIYYAVFHSISAFCNAGFDLFPASMVEYSSNPIVMLTIPSLILLGGLGFVVWSNILASKFRFKKMNLHTKIALVCSAALIVIPTVLYMIFDWNYTLKGMNFGEKLLGSIFQVVSPRTAGFFSVDLTSMSDSSYILQVLLMFIGGNSGSTAGGIKISTFVVVMYSIFAEVAQRDDIRIRKRKLPSGLAKSASAILFIYLTVITLGSMTICAIESFSIKEVLYEVVSAICTVGLTLGITPELHVVSKLILIFLMFIGRVGSVSFLLAFGEKKENPPIDYPTEKIMVG